MLQNQAILPAPKSFTSSKGSLRGQTREVLRDVACVLHWTRKIKDSILLEQVREEVVQC